MARGGQFTPPPTLTLNTKYDGVPTINPYVGYAVQVVDKSGNRKVVIGACHDPVGVRSEPRGSGTLHGQAEEHGCSASHGVPAG